MKASQNIAMFAQLQKEQSENMEAAPNEQVLGLLRNMARVYAENVVKNGSSKTKHKKAS